MSVLDVVLAGSIGSYEDIKSKVGLWLNRSDLDSRIPDFILLAEARLNRELRTLNQETYASFTTDAAGYALPSNFRRLKRICIASSPNQQLVQISGNVALERGDTVTGTPTAYWIDDRTIYFQPAPDGSTSFNMTYVARIEPLTSDNETNWVLDEHPDAYLIGALLEAAVYIRDEDAIAYLGPRFSDIIAAINLASRRDAWAGGPIAPQGPIQVAGGRC